MLKRVLAFLIALLMTVALVPVMALGASQGDVKSENPSAGSTYNIPVTVTFSQQDNDGTTKGYYYALATVKVSMTSADLQHVLNHSAGDGTSNPAATIATTYFQLISGYSVEGGSGNIYTDWNVFYTDGDDSAAIAELQTELARPASAWAPNNYNYPATTFVEYYDGSKWTRQSQTTTGVKSIGTQIKELTSHDDAVTVADYGELWRVGMFDKTNWMLVIALRLPEW